MNFAAIVDEAIRAVCPEIDGVSIGNEDDRSTWRIDFRPGATAKQRSDAVAAMNAVDPRSVTKTKDARIFEMLGAYGVTIGDLKSALNRANGATPP